MANNMIYNICQIVPRIAKRACASGAAGITLLITALFTSNVYAQNTGTPSQLRVKVDANNYLILIAAAQTAPVSSPTVFNNIRLKTDSSNQLYVVVTGNITPTTITCSGSIGTTSSVLVGGNPCTWSANPTLSTGVNTPKYKLIYGSTQTNYYFGTGGATNIFGQLNAYSATNLGIELTGVSLDLANPAFSLEGISANGAATFPIVNSYTFRSQGNNSVTAASGQLWGFQNFGDESNSILWCRTDAVNCTTVVGGGTLKYIYDFSRATTAITKISILRFTASILADVDNTVDIGAVGATRPRTGYFGTSIVTPTVNATTALQQNGVAAALAVASGYKIARGSIALDGSNPTTVATGLTTVISCTSDLRRTTALGTGTAFLTHDTPSGANVDFYGWILAGTASTGTETFEWICVGT